MLEKILDFGRTLIPASLFQTLQPVYHYLLAMFGAVFYLFPSRELTVIAVTGTKGKTSTVELINAILEADGKITALAGTLRIKVAGDSQPNLFKMTIKGRFFLQRFLRRAVRAGCTHAIIELTSEGAKQFRHKFIDLDALVFTNLAPEHIESHGSYQKYLEAKLEIAKQLAKSKKLNKFIVVNGDDQEHEKFLQAVDGESQVEKIIYKLTDAEPHYADDKSTELTIENSRIKTRLPGRFNLYNLLGAISLARAYQVPVATIKTALESFAGIRGRMEPVGWQEFDVLVDYAHTPDSLKAVYETLNQRRKICVLGGTGGGRDHWKRPLMGQIADDYCYRIILTDEDPYDEDPEKIVQEVASGIKSGNYEIVLDRREAIRKAVQMAKKDDVVIITGKGTDPYIMGPKNTKTPWSDASVAHEELEKLKNARTA
ncbi:MAG: UDP-N-acetylmuramoyl-L-alanyl-D-glutamate--2,6-diaminopimelate ligase [Patescibacteria group bacterium]